MELALCFIGIMSGVVWGIVAWDMAQRRADRAGLKAREAELKDAQAKLAELHNSSVSQLKAMSEKVQAIDMMLSAGSQARNPFMGHSTVGNR